MSPEKVNRRSSPPPTKSSLMSGSPGTRQRRIWAPLSDLMIRHRMISDEFRREFKLAEPTLLEAIQILRESGYRHAEFLAVGNLGATYVAQGRFAEAAPYLEEGIRLGEEVGDRLNTARNHLALGDARQSLGAGDDARREWSLAHAIFIDVDSVEAAEAQARLGAAQQVNPRAG